MDPAVVDLLVEGLWLMGIGMGIVFSFLLILVGTLHLMSKAVARWGPEEALPATVDTAHTPAGRATGGDRLIAVITAAIHEHRKRHRS
jgi:oxaloacetate decarboxylase (Na+ extruding) subunit gamma